MNLNREKFTCCIALLFFVFGVYAVVKSFTNQEKNPPLPNITIRRSESKVFAPGRKQYVSVDEGGRNPFSFSEGWKDQLENLEAIHDMGTFRNDYYKEGGVDSVNSALKNVGSAVHKVIETHPVSGLKYLNVNQAFTRNIVNENQGPSDQILQFLFQHINKPEFHVRFHWEDNSVAIWDNRITQHYAICDYLPELRHMQRITVINDKRELSQK